MRSSLLFPLAAASYAVAQQVNTTYLTGLVNALNSWNLTDLTNGLTSLASDPTAQSLLAQLPNGTKTVFAPDNDALSSSGSSGLTTDQVAYHILSGTFTANNIAVDPTHSVGRTFLNDPSYVQLEGNKSQALVIDRSNTTIFVLNQASTVPILQSHTYENLVVHTIGSVLLWPSNITVLAGNLTGFSSAAAQAGPGVLSALEAAHGITIFAPNDQAFTNAQSSLSGANSSTVTTVLGNHIINGTTVYSTQLGSGYTSASGEGFSFSSNSTGSYVTSGGTTARIVQSDALIKNGVVHVIDTVLLNTQANPSAASSAYVAATSKAASAASSTQTGPVGSGSSSHSAALASIGVNPWNAVAVALGVAAGAFFTL